MLAEPVSIIYTELYVITNNSRRTRNPATLTSLSDHLEEVIPERRDSTLILCLSMKQSVSNIFYSMLFD